MRFAKFVQLSVKQTYVTIGPRWNLCQGRPWDSSACMTNLKRRQPPLETMSQPTSPKPAPGITTFDSLRPQTLSQRVALELVKSILSAEFEPGDLLPTEEQLCQQLGVSRSVIRESVKAVAALGLVNSRQGKGTVVLGRDNWNEFSSELLAARAELGSVQPMLSELMAMRRALEADAAAATAAGGAADRLTEAKKILEEIGSVTPDNAAQMLGLDVDFHEAVVRAAGNDLISGFFHKIRPMLVSARQIAYELEPEIITKGFEEHAAIVEAIESGDPSQAYEVMFRHLSSTKALQSAGDGYLPVRMGDN